MHRCVPTLRPHGARHYAFQLPQVHGQESRNQEMLDQQTSLGRIAGQGGPWEAQGGVSATLGRPAENLSVHNAPGEPDRARQ